MHQSYGSTVGAGVGTGCPSLAEQRIDTASLEQLETWCDRVLDATTLDEVFG
jgi:hypothetical protein